MTPMPLRVSAASPGILAEGFRMLLEFSRFPV